AADRRRVHPRGRRVRKSGRAIAARRNFRSLLQWSATMSCRSVLLALLLLGHRALATTVTVVPGDTAAANIAKIEGAGPGDEVVVAPGVYRFRLYLQGQGTAAAPIVIRALDPADRPVWDLAGDVVASWPGSYAGGDAGRSIWQITGSHYEISGIIFRNGTDGGIGDSGGLRLKSSGPVALRDCLFQFNDNGI